jgi:hypothetical protein
MEKKSGLLLEKYEENGFFRSLFLVFKFKPSFCANQITKKEEKDGDF